MVSVASSTTTQNTSEQPQIVHSFSEPYQLSESSKSDVETDAPLSLAKKLKKPTITVTATGSTGTSSTASMDSQSNSTSTASETLQTNSSHSSTTEVDVVQEARSPCPSKPVRVHIQYPCSLYQDSNYLPPKKLSSMIEEMIKDGMPRLMRKIVAETKLAYKKPANIFNFDVLPEREDATPPCPTTGATDKEEPVGPVSTEQEVPDVAQTIYTLSDPPNKSDVCQAQSSDGQKSSDSEADETFVDNTVVDQNVSPTTKSATLPQNITDLFQNKLQRSNSLMSERRRMDILRNMSQSVKDRLRRHSSSVGTSSTPGSLDLCHRSTNSSPTSATPTGSRCATPTNYSVNIMISSTAVKPHRPQASDESFVPAPKNKVRRWISFNYGDKTKSKAAQKYMKQLEQPGGD